VILVNGQTRGAAEDLAVRLRTAGADSSSQHRFTGENFTGHHGAVSADDEKKFLENPFASAVTNTAASLSLTNNLVPFVDHMSEAELVRKRIKDGEDEGDSTMPRAEPAQRSSATRRWRGGGFDQGAGGFARVTRLSP